MYLSKNTCQTTPEEHTPVCIRIQLSRATVKDLHSRLQHAYQRDEVRLGDFRKISYCAKVGMLR